MTDVAPSPIAARSVATFGGIARRTGKDPENDRPDFVAIRASAEFGTLRHRFRTFVFPMSALFFVWYLTYVLLAAYARGFMSHRLVGSVNVGLVLGLLQFVSTIAITWAYLRYARRRIDPQVRLIRGMAGVADK
jgi:uncharacterized membrane protein (DUF485 family)